MGDGQAGIEKLDNIRYIIFVKFFIVEDRILSAHHAGVFDCNIEV